MVCDVNASPGDNLQTKLNSLTTGQTLCLAPGYYPLTSPLNLKAGTTLHGTWESVLTGALTVTAWTSRSGKWVNTGSLPADYAGEGECENLATSPCQKRERLFEDDTLLVKVMTEAAVVAGTFYANYTLNELVIGSYNPGSIYQLSRSEGAIQSNAADVTLDGFAVERFATTAQRAAVMAEGDRWEVNNIHVRQCHAKGIAVNNSVGTHITNCTTVDNGQMGIGSYMATGLVISGNTVLRNNTDGFWRHDWEAAGIKITWTAAVIDGNTVSDNDGIGVWADIECENVTISNNLISGNASDGVRYEISRNARIVDNTIINNANRILRGLNDGSIWVAAGIVVSTAYNILVARNLLVGNLHGVSVQYRERGSADAGDFGHFDTYGVAVIGNIIDLRPGGSLVGIVGDTQYQDALLKRSTVLFARNWYQSTSPTSFQLLGVLLNRDQWASRGYT